MMRVNHPAIGLLTPEPVAQVPAGFTLHKILLDQLIPARLPLTLPGSSGLLVLGVPSARARAWGEMPEASLVASATWQRAEAATSADLAASFGEARARLAPCLTLIEDGRIADVCPLIVGVRSFLGRGPINRRQAVAEILVLDFQLTASALGRPSAVGCRLDLAIRGLSGTAEFRAPMAERPLQQADLARNPDALPLDTGFSSEVERIALADGTPVGGMDWWLSNGRP